MNMRHCRLNRKDLKKYLAKRYHNKIAETIVSCFDFSMPWDHTHFLEGLETLVNNPDDSLRKMIFNCYDGNNDHFISEIDLFLVMKSISSGKYFVTSYFII